MIVVLDTETSGLPRESRATVLELGAVLLTPEADAIVAEFGCLIRPPKPLGEWAAPAMKVNGIDQALLVDAPSAESAWNAFDAWLDMYQITSVLAYNVAFDRKMMERTFDDQRGIPWGPCIMEASAKALDWHKKWIKLDEACRQLGIPQPSSNRHRAVTDAKMAARVVWKLMQRGGWNG